MKRYLSIVTTVVFIAALTGFAVVRERRGAAYRLAGELPRGALIYVQVADLPALVNRWKDSELRRRYLESDNFAELQKRHLALKLADRAAEIESALGFVPDLDFAGALGQKDAALAVYDIGRLEFVFVAPISAEIKLASSLMAHSEAFEQMNKNGVDFFAREIEVDRGRQRQKVMFTEFRERLVLATSEREFFRTIDILRGRGGESIADEPSFRELSAKLAPHLATVWTDQRKLAEDWYFRHYFSHPDDVRVKEVRAAMFDLDESENALTERRVFLTATNAGTPVDAATSRKLTRFVPTDAAIAAISSADTTSAAMKVLTTAFGSPDIAEDSTAPKNNFRFYDWDSEMWGRETGVTDEINVREAESRATALGDPTASIAASLSPASPVAIAEVLQPQSLPTPFVIDDRRAVVIALRNPAAFDRARFELAVADAAVGRTTAGVAEFDWKESGEFRELHLRGLGWSVFYTIREGQLIVSRGSEQLASMLSTEGISLPAGSITRFARFVPDAANVPFNQLFDVFDRNDRGDLFFAKVAGSLFDVAKGLRSAELTERRSGNLTFETVTFDY